MRAKSSSGFIRCSVHLLDKQRTFGVKQTRIKLVAFVDERNRLDALVQCDLSCKNKGSKFDQNEGWWTARIDSTSGHSLLRSTSWPSTLTVGAATQSFDNWLILFRILKFEATRAHMPARVFDCFTICWYCSSVWSEIWIYCRLLYIISTHPREFIGDHITTVGLEW